MFGSLLLVRSTTEPIFTKPNVRGKGLSLRFKTSRPAKAAKCTMRILHFQDSPSFLGGFQSIPLECVSLVPIFLVVAQTLRPGSPNPEARRHGRLKTHLSVRGHSSAVLLKALVQDLKVPDLTRRYGSDS